MQATHSGFSLINQDNVFKVCDQPHPLLVANMINHCLSAKIDPAFGIMKNLCDLGYSATDIITTLFRVVRNYKMQEFLKLEFIKVCVVDWIGIYLIMLQFCSALGKAHRVHAVLAEIMVRDWICTPGMKPIALGKHHALSFAAILQEVGFCHLRISDGVNSRLQLSGLLAKLCKVTMKSR